MGFLLGRKGLFRHPPGKFVVKKLVWRDQWEAQTCKFVASMYNKCRSRNTMLSGLRFKSPTPSSIALFWHVQILKVPTFVSNMQCCHMLIHDWSIVLWKPFSDSRIDIVTSFSEGIVLATDNPSLHRIIACIVLGCFAWTWLTWSCGSPGRDFHHVFFLNFFGVRSQLHIRQVLSMVRNDWVQARGLDWTIHPQII